jgi:1-acyl-sn-glycerol-3-phosphate acyltransferase
MLYKFVKIVVRMAMPFAAKRIRILHAAQLQTPGPLLLAVNHPNSFLDAILLGAYMKHPVHFITRGDVFKKAWIRKLLHLLNMIPIYRIRDGKHMLSLNEETFVKSVEVLRNNGILLIFVEGFCANQTTLQLPLKKGAPRILQACWQQGIPAKVLPVWLEYSSFNRISKSIDIRLGDVFGSEIANDLQSATCVAQINQQTEQQLMHLCSEVPFVHQSPALWKRMVLFLPAMLGAVLHAPLYLPLTAFVQKVSKDNVHYDSILIAILFVLYPLVLLLCAAALFSFTKQWQVWPLVLLGLPALALSYIHWKE